MDHQPNAPRLYEWRAAFSPSALKSEFTGEGVEKVLLAEKSAWSKAREQDLGAEAQGQEQAGPFRDCQLGSAFWQCIGPSLRRWLALLAMEVGGSGPHSQELGGRHQWPWAGPGQSAERRHLLWA